MSITPSLLTKRLKALLQARTNAEVLTTVQRLHSRPEPKPDPLIVAIHWTPGEPMLSATITILSPTPPVAINDIASALRAGQTVLQQQMIQVTAQAQSEAAELRQQLALGPAAAGLSVGEGPKTLGPHTTPSDDDHNAGKPQE